jgi:hypothetical protein
MHVLKHGGLATLAAAAILSLAVSTVAASDGATVESFPLDDRWSHEEPNGEVYWFDVTGDVRIVTMPDGRSSATVHVHETQTLLLGDDVLMESRSVSMQHAISFGDDLYLLHMTNRTRWTNTDGGGDYTVVLQIVDGRVVVDHSS